MPGKKRVLIKLSPENRLKAGEGRAKSKIQRRGSRTVDPLA